MELKDAIFTRRSVRRYSDRPVSADDLKEILAAAMMAPSAGNQQPWHFVTITDREKLDAVTRVNPNAGMAARAPAAVLVCGDEAAQKFPGYWVQDCTAALQNMLLAAHDRGLGAVWTGIWPLKDRVSGFRELFGLPESVQPLGLVVLGYPVEEAGKPDIPNRFNADRIHSEAW